MYAVHPHHRLPAGHVPQDHHIVTACVGKQLSLTLEMWAAFRVNLRLRRANETPWYFIVKLLRHS